MTEGQIISKLIIALQEQMVEIAEDAMLRPKNNSFDHGVQAGRYQGISSALDTLHAIISDKQSKQDNL